MKRITLISLCAFFALSAFAQRRTAVNSPNVPTPITIAVYDSAKPRDRGELIKPIKVWRNGQSLDAESIDCTIVYDDLEGSAKVLFQLKDSANVEIANGNIDIYGADYRSYNKSDNKIVWTYNFVIRTLRLQNRNQPVN